MNTQYALTIVPFVNRKAAKGFYPALKICGQVHVVHNSLLQHAPIVYVNNDSMQSCNCYTKAAGAMRMAIKSVHRFKCEYDDVIPLVIKNDYDGVCNITGRA